MSEKKLKWCTAVAVTLTFAAALTGGYFLGKTSEISTVPDTLIITDTVTYRMPVPTDSTVVRYVTRVLPAAGGHAAKPQGTVAGAVATEMVTEMVTGPLVDSAAVQIPITRKRYEGDDYCAWVSGYEPQLDSISVYPKTTVIRERSYKPPNKWHIGIMGGYGYGFTSKQAEPFVGVGIMYSILSF